MNDYELNKAISLLLHEGSELTVVPLNDISSQTMTCLDGYYKPLLNFNNWNDLMPLVVENMFNIEISKNEVYVKDIIFDENVNLVFYKIFKEDDCSQEDKQNITKRALAECLLKVLESKI